MIVKCKCCGLEANTKEQAEMYFIKYYNETKHSKYRPLCKKCKKQNVKPTRIKQGETYREMERIQNRSKRLKYYKENLEHIKNHFGGIKCSICNYTDDSFAPFDFHHLDPTQKEFGIAKKMDSSPFNNWKTELDKCILVCANCHRKIHNTRNLDDN